MSFLARLSIAAALVVGVAATVAAHPMTIKGTVAGIEAKRIQVKTGDEKAGDKPAWYAIDTKTKIMRGEATVSFEKAKITTGERVVVILDHDEEGGPMKATEIRLAAASGH